MEFQQHDDESVYAAYLVTRMGELEDAMREGSFCFCPGAHHEYLNIMAEIENLAEPTVLTFFTRKSGMYAHHQI